MTRNTRIIEEMYDNFAKGDIPAVLAALDPEVSWTEADGFPHGGTYKGPDAVLENVFMNLGTEWETFSAIPARFIADQDTVVTLGDYAGTYKATGKRFQAPFAHIWQLRDEKVVQFRQLTDTAVVQSATT